MTDDLDELGPIDYLVIEFPGSRMTGEGLPILADLVDRGIIRILDLVFVKKETDGSVVGMEIADFDHDGTLDLAIFEGLAFHHLVLDEVQTVKNPRSLPSRAVREIQARHHLCLSGTPIENNLEEL